ncbi:MAG: lipid core-O-antigen ligase-like enyme [Planctomycetota bacterium]|nr:lipid core-O-antigen ligase-like enyme [Planctomycetota bacterium]
MNEVSASKRWARRCSEAIILALSCLAPWAFGSVEAWAELTLDLGIVLAAALGIIAGRGSARARDALFGMPSLALAGLSLLTLAQAVPLPEGLLARVDPAAASTREALVPRAGERVLGDPGPPVPLPPSTLSLAPEESVHAAARLAAAWVLFQGVLNLGVGSAGLRRFGVAIAANSAAMALFALVQSMTWNGKIYGSRASPILAAWSTGGPFVGHNPLAAYLNLGLGLSLGFLLPTGHHTSGPWRGFRAWAAYSTGLTIVGLVASQSRSGMVATVVASAVLAVAMRRGTVRAGAAVAASVAIVALLLASLGVSSPYRRLTSLLDGAAYSDRLEIWAGAIRSGASHPLFGSGLGSFAVAVAPVFRHDDGVVFARAENEYFDLLVEGGLFGLGLAVAGLVSLARSGFRALRAAPTPSDRSLVAGGLFGLTALAIQSLGDFSPHIPGVAIPAIVLCGHLCHLGMVRQARPVAAGSRRLPSFWPGLMTAALGLVLLDHSFYRARAEARLAGSGVPPPGAGMPEAISRAVPGRDLERMRAALAAALRDRPDWAEGHLRLGMVLLSQYERAASEWVVASLDDPEIGARLADPLWLHATVHSAPPGAPVRGEEVIEHDPVRRHLVPAARCFLEARRCCPALASAHAHLATLDYLLEGGEPSPVHADRALRLSGADSQVLLLAARVAAQAGDSRLAARVWKKSIEVRESNWEDVADAAAVALSAEQILEWVLPPGGRWPILFADRLYTGPEDVDSRARYLRAALPRLRDDGGLAEPERLRLEALARAGLDDHERARALWERALALEPLSAPWRQEFVAWLVGRRDFEAAHRHAVIGVRLNPQHPGLHRAMLETAEALARGKRTPRSD